MATGVVLLCSSMLFLRFLTYTLGRVTIALSIGCFAARSDGCSHILMQKKGFNSIKFQLTCNNTVPSFFSFFWRFIDMLSPSLEPTKPSTWNVEVFTKLVCRLHFQGARSTETVQFWNYFSFNHSTSDQKFLRSYPR